MLHIFICTYYPLDLSSPFAVYQTEQRFQSDGKWEWHDHKMFRARYSHLFHFKCYYHSVRAPSSDNKIIHMPNCYYSNVIYAVRRENTHNSSFSTNPPFHKLPFFIYYYPNDFHFIANENKYKSFHWIYAGNKTKICDHYFNDFNGIVANIMGISRAYSPIQSD